MLPKNTIKTLIVDDMSPAREYLRAQLELIDNVKVIAEAANVDDAIKIILENKPNLVFLDVNMPDKNGFDLLDEIKKCPQIVIDIVFITGFAEHALKSFDYFPFHFLLKPVSSQKLKKVIDKYKIERAEKSFAKKLDQLKNNAKICFKGENSYLFLHRDEIIWLKADRNYTRVYLENGEKELVSDNLGTIEAILPSDSFFRTHRSYIINLNAIRKINQRNGIVILKANPFDENPLVSKENIATLIKRLEI